MQTLRKILAISVIFVTVLSMSVVVAPKAHAAASAGDLIKESGLSSVYFLGTDGKRYVFPNEATYFSWYSDFSAVVTVPQSELEALPLGANVTIRPGTKLVKITTNPNVYAVTPGGTLVRVPDETTAATLYGANWAKRVVDVPDAFFTNYKVSANVLSASAYPAGSLIKTATDPNVYYINTDGTASKITTETAFNANRFMFSNVITTTLAIPTAGADIVSAITTITDTSSGAGGTIAAGGSGLTVALSGMTAPSGSIVAGQATADLGSFNVTASNDGAVQVNIVKIHRIGISSDGAVNNLYLYDGLNRLTDGSSFSSSVATFSNAAGIITVPAGQTKTISVKADIAVGSTGNIGVAVNAAADITTNGATVSGSFPINGNQMSLVAVTSPALSTVSLGSTVGGGLNVNAGTMAATVFSSNFSVGVKAVTFKYIRFNEVGSVPTDALQNISLYVNGVKAGNSGVIDANGNVAFDLTGAPVTLNTGSNTVEVRADIVKGSSRTFKFSVQSVADMLLIDNNYNVAVAATGTLTPVDTTTISAGSVSVSADSTFNATQVVKNSSNVTISRYTMKAYGEDMKVQNLVVTPTLAPTTGNHLQATEGLSNISLYVNGSQVGSSKNMLTAVDLGNNVSLSAGQSYGTSNLFVIPAGTTVTLEVRADLTQVSSSNVASVKGEFTSATYLGVSSSQGASTGVVTGEPTLSVITGNLTIGGNFNNQIGLANTAHTLIGSYILQAGSAEAVRVTNLAVVLSGTASTSGTWNNLSNLVTSVNTTPVQAQGTVNFPVNITLPANGTQTVNVYADLGNVSPTQTIQTTLNVTANGVNTNNSVGGSLPGGVLTINTGALGTPTLISNSPVAQLVTPGAFLGATYKFVATNGTANISEMTFNAFSGTTSTPDLTGLKSVSVDGGVTNFAVVNGVAHLTGLTVVVPAGFGGLQLPITLTYNPVTSANNGGAVTRTSVGVDLVSYKATVGNVTATTVVDAPSNSMILVASAPTVTKAADTPVAITSYAGGADSDVLHFTVTAPVSGAINLKGIGFTTTYSSSEASGTAAAQVVKIYDANSQNTQLGTSMAMGATGSEHTYTFTSDFLIAAGTSHEFIVKADTTGISVSGNSFRLDLTANGDTAVSTGSVWQWNDNTTAAYGNGYLVMNLPITGNTFSH